MRSTYQSQAFGASDAIPGVAVGEQRPWDIGMMQRIDSRDARPTALDRGADCDLDKRCPALNRVGLFRADARCSREEKACTAVLK
jgi:hypothetical protein